MLTTSIVLAAVFVVAVTCWAWSGIVFHMAFYAFMQGFWI